MAAIRYCLPITNFSKEEWDYIIAPAKKQVLRKAEMQSTFPKAPLYGSQKFDGYVFEHPYTNQGIEKIAIIQQEIVNMTQTGTLITSTAEGFRLELGSNTKISDIKWEKVKSYLTKSWYKGLVEFIHKSNKRRLPKKKRAGETISPIKRLDISEDLPMIPTLRENDSFIMTAFINANIS